MTKADNLQMNLGANNVTALLPYNASATGPVVDDPWVKSLFRISEVVRLGE